MRSTMMQQMHDEKKGLGELIKALDTDGDGEVSQKELFGHKNYKPDPGTPDDEKAIQMKMLDAFFNAADENADKKLVHYMIYPYETFAHHSHHLGRQ